MNYNLNTFVQKYQHKDLGEILAFLFREVPHLDGLYAKLKRNQDDGGLIFYRAHLGDFLFFLQNGVVPAGIGKDGLALFRPILENLVQKNTFKPEVLNLLN
ncbi:hypothetical protein ABDJ41_20750 [Pedobacter sp. ASV1-7]|uniref:hypothetical protein n=1 Tax=Pedobacter sp. ASV1-7 TaxID=3145237 RepID=UPI0032E92FE2